jgi:hypothetical protein
LQLACGSYESALDVLGRSLARAGRDKLPRSASAVVAFVREHVLRVLEDEIGPRLATALGEDLVAALGEQLPMTERITIPPASVSRAVNAQPARVSRGANAPLGVALVDADRVGRTVLARALVRERWNVTVVDSLPVDEGTDPDPLDVALVDEAHPAAQAILESLVQTHPGIVVVVRASTARKLKAQPLAGVQGARRVEVTAEGASPEEVIKAIRRAWSS